MRWLLLTHLTVRLLCGALLCISLLYMLRAFCGMQLRPALQCYAGTPVHLVGTVPQVCPLVLCRHASQDAFHRHSPGPPHQTSPRHPLLHRRAAPNPASCTPCCHGSHTWRHHHHSSSTASCACHSCCLCPGSCWQCFSSSCCNTFRGSCGCWRWWRCSGCCCHWGIFRCCISHGC